jgi:simple sugar transport system permease protein
MNGLVRDDRSAVWIVAAAVVIVLVGTGGVLALSGLNVGRATSALVTGAFGSWYAFGSGTLVRATPLILTGLAVAIAFRAGVFNIGAEGVLARRGCGYRGRAHSSGLPALVTMWARSRRGDCGSGVGVDRGHLATPVSRARGDQHILLNFVAANLVSYLVRGPMQEPTHIYPQTPTISLAAQLPRLGATTRLHLGFVIAIVACVASWWVIRYTAGGFRLRVVGANPHAARSAGQIDVERVTMRAFLTSGAFAGLAGAIEVCGVTYALYENISPGYGFTAIAVAARASERGGRDPYGNRVRRARGRRSGDAARRRSSVGGRVRRRGGHNSRHRGVSASSHRPLQRGRRMSAASAFLEATVRTATPLALAALGEVVVERAGIINISLEGVILSGAFGALIGATRFGVAGGFVAGIVSGVVMAIVFAAFVIRLRLTRSSREPRSRCSPLVSPERCIEHCTGPRVQRFRFRHSGQRRFPGWSRFR